MLKAAQIIELVGFCDHKFHDPLDKDGTNCTGIFVVRITPNEDDKRLYLNVYGLMICMQVKE